MNTIIAFLIEVAVTLAISLLVTRYLGAPLKRMLTILCGTEEGGQFWTAFSSIVLIGLPVIFSLTYRPGSEGAEKLFFEVMSRLSMNFGGYLAALIVVGVILSFFSLVGMTTSFFTRVMPRPVKAEAK